MYIYGSHDTMTYLKLKCFLGWLAIPFAKCQNKTIQEQYNVGVRCFDLRVTFDKEGNPIFANGIAKFEGDVWQILNCLKDMSNVHVRVILEDTKVNERNVVKFLDFCYTLSSKFPNIKCFGGNRRCDWKVIYTFTYNPSLAQSVGSMAEDARWYEKLIPWFYAKRRNKKNRIKNWTEDIVTFDFV